MTSTQSLQIRRAHPLADRFPMLPADEMDRLVEDIRVNGLLSPIMVDTDGLILDGRNRALACERLGIEPDTELFTGDDVAAFVLSVNVARRHMSTGARAMSTALVLSDSSKRENGKWAYGVINVPDSERSGQWKQRMAEAGTVLDYVPELADKVVSGDMALDAAYKKAETVRDQERQALAEQERIEAEETEAKTKLAELAPQLLDRIGTKYGSARQAFTAWEDNNRAKAARLRREKQEAERKAKAEWKANQELYSSIVHCVTVMDVYADRDPNELMANLQPGMLMPNEIRDFTPFKLRRAACALTNLADWKEEN